MIFVFDSIENIVQKGENAGYQHFLLFPLFSKGLSGFSPEIFEGVVAFSGVVKLGSITNVNQSAT